MTERSKPRHENSVEVESFIEDSHLTQVGFPNGRSSALRIDPESLFRDLVQPQRQHRRIVLKVTIRR